MLVELYPRVHRRYSSLAIIGSDPGRIRYVAPAAGLLNPIAPASTFVLRLVWSAVYSNAACRH